VSDFEIEDLVRYFHNVKNQKDELVPIIGEDKLAITAALSYLLEDTNFMINAYSGTGKTVIMNAVFGLIDGTGIPYVVIEQLSDTALWYDMERINSARFIAIPEAQKCPESIIEILKTWADDRPAERRRTDVTIQDIRRQTLHPKFVFMCKAVENTRGNLFLDAELERRYMITHTNPTVKQTEDVLKQKLKAASSPDGDLQTMSDEEIQSLKNHIVDCIVRRDDARAVKLRNPCAPFLFDVIPTLFPIARSKIHYFLKVINAVARFFPDDIMTVEREGETYGLVTPKHNWLATQIYIDTFVTECLQMPSHGIDILHLIPDSEMDTYGMISSDVTKMSTKEIQQAARAAGLPFAQKNINPLLQSLVMLGFLEMEENERKKHSFFKSPLIREPSTKIKWPDLITETQSLMRASWPEIAEDYISTYCTDVEITNPFTKEKVSLIGSPKENQTKPETYTETSPEEYGEWLNG
jgi:hypothetical protein|tara:strand:+ start:1124 stop:2527 length:1404 start_codon:yes stop_codon:yes gene_type:complete